jgi:hypothetical protein
METAVIALITVSILVAGCFRVRQARRMIADAEMTYLSGIVSGPTPVGQRTQGRSRSAVAGQLGGYPVGMELVIDTLIMRRLPQQLLVVRFPVRLRAGQAVEAVRADIISPLFAAGVGDGTETVLHEQAGDVTVRPGGADQQLPAAARGHLLALVKDRNVQQLLITPHGIRLVYQVGVARREKYKVTRKVVIDRIPSADPALQAALATTRSLVEVLGTASRQAAVAAREPAPIWERSDAA